MIDETFLTTDEVLEYLHVNLRTVYRLIKAGKIPAVRVGRQWRFRKRDIDAWLDLLIADLKMPGMDGMALIRESRRYKPDLAVIIITGFSTEASAVDALNLGVVGYLRKPFRIKHVLDLAAKALGEEEGHQPLSGAAREPPVG